MSTSASGADPLGHLADEFLERHRRGEQPALTEYTARHPELAEQIRELFPALLMMEGVRPEPVPLRGAPLKHVPKSGYRSNNQCSGVRVGCAFASASAMVRASTVMSSIWVRSFRCRFKSTISVMQTQT